MADETVRSNRNKVPKEDDTACMMSASIVVNDDDDDDETVVDLFNNTVYPKTVWLLSCSFFARIGVTNTFRTVPVKSKSSTQENR